MIDPLIAALIAKIPPPETMWRATDRALWINAMAHAFAIVYRGENASVDGLPLIKAVVVVDIRDSERPIALPSTAILPETPPRRTRRGTGSPAPQAVESGECCTIGDGEP